MLSAAPQTFLFEVLLSHWLSQGQSRWQAAGRLGNVEVNKDSGPLRRLLQIGYPNRDILWSLKKLMLEAPVRYLGFPPAAAAVTLHLTNSS